MKKLLVGLTLLGSMSSFANVADCDAAIEGLAVAVKDTVLLEISLEHQEKAMVPENSLESLKKRIVSSQEMIAFESKKIKSWCSKES